MNELTRQSPAKINLTLRVGPLRPDGFHPLESLVARVALCDTITVNRRDDRRLTLECDDPTVPADDSNLALRAAHALAQTTDERNPGFHIKIKKRIPAGAGLGGGSSNAATTLMLLNELWNTRVPTAELAELAAQLGSDVPLFFHGPLCLMRGRGEIIQDIPHTLNAWVVLVLPELHAPTGSVYKAFDRLPAPPARPSADDLLAEITAREPAARLEALNHRLFNDLEPAATAVIAELARVAADLAKLSDNTIRMTGSGAAFFRLFAEKHDAQALADRIHQELLLPTRVTQLATA